MKQPMQQQQPNQGRQIPIVCPGHTRPLAELHFCSIKDENRTLLVSACHDKMPMLRDGVTGDWIGTFAGHKGAVWSCKLDPSGNLTATASADYSVKVWDGITGKQLYHFAHEHIVKSCDFSLDSCRLATAGHEGIVRVYELITPDVPPMIIHMDIQKKIVVTKCIWLSNTLLLVGCADGIIRVWDIPSNKDNIETGSTTIPITPIHTLSLPAGEEAEIRDMEICQTMNGQRILTVAAGNKVYFFNLLNYTPLQSYTMPMHFKDEGGASLHPSGTMFVAGGSDLWVRVFDYATGQQLECLKGHHGPIRCIRYAPGGDLYASGSEDGTIRLWRTNPDQ